MKIFNRQNLVNKFKKYDWMRYCYLFLYNFNNSDFKNLIFNRRNFIEIKTFGPLNNKKNIYYIYINKYFGFGAYLRRTMHALFAADKYNFMPVIEWGKSVYGEDKLILGTNNVFEYYFVQPVDICLNEMYHSNNVFIFDSAHLYKIDRDLKIIKNDEALIVGYENITDEYIYEMSLIVQRYIKLNDTSKEFIFNSQKNLFKQKKDGQKILGVHVRGTDYALHWNNHPNIITNEQFCRKIDEAIDKMEFEYIFLATDDVDRLKFFKCRYGNKLLYYKDVHRGNGTVNISYEKTNRQNDHYLNGLEVLRDMYTLAICEGFVAGGSQISILARIINKSMNLKYQYIDIIDNGIYKK